MPAYPKSKINHFQMVELFAIGAMFLSLKMKSKILYFVILLFCYFGRGRNTLISASFRLDKATNLK